MANKEESVGTKEEVVSSDEGKSRHSISISKELPSPPSSSSEDEEEESHSESHALVKKPDPNIIPLLDDSSARKPENDDEEDEESDSDSNAPVKKPDPDIIIPLLIASSARKPEDDEDPEEESAFDSVAPVNKPDPNVIPLLNGSSARKPKDDEDEDEESDSDSDAPVNKPDPNVIPLLNTSSARKPKDDEDEDEEADSASDALVNKPDPYVIPLIEVSCARKRKEDNEDENEESDSDSGAPVASCAKERKEDGDDDHEAEDIESDSHSDAPVEKANPNIKPLLDVSSAGSKPRTAGVKRLLEKENEARETKKSKKALSSSAVINDDPKKQLFQRIWSEEDELVLLNGMINYSAKKKANPVADIGAFLKFIKKSLRIDVTNNQLKDKIRRLKKKFENNFLKENNGKERTFSKIHEQNSYKLSKRIWGETCHKSGTPEVSGSVLSKRRSTNNIEDEQKKVFVVEDSVQEMKKEIVGRGLGHSSLPEWIINNGAKMVNDEKREEMEEKWKNIQMQEVELFLKKAELMCEQTRLVLEAMRKSRR